jgi:PBSX family phage portal protein
VFYLSDAGVNTDDVDKIRESLRKAKGVGNFKNLFLHSPNGKKDGVQIIPISEVAARDEFVGIKNTTRDDILAAHRVPPQLLGVVPAVAGGFGDVEKASYVFFRNEIEALQTRFLEVNDWLGVEAVKFAPYDISLPAAAA